MKRRRSAGSFRLSTAFAATLTTFASLGVAAVAVSGCEGIVSDSLPSSIACSGDAAGTCPLGQECTHGVCAVCSTFECMGFVADAGHDATFDAGHDAGHDAGFDARPDAPAVEASKDTGAEAAPASGALGKPCGSNLTCASGLCATQADLTGLNVASGICSKPCCADSDCAADGFHCFATAGGNLCVPNAIADCENTSCATACCGSSGCGDGSSCAFPDEGDGGVGTVASCQPFGGDNSFCGTDGSGGDGCDDNADCQSGLCVGTGGQGVCDQTACTTPCCNDAVCQQQDPAATCQWLDLTTSTGNLAAFVHVCNGSNASTASGDSCSTDADCKGNVCANKVCTGPCCTDDDCSGLNNGPWACLPYDHPLTVGTIPILVCQQTRPLH
jgi:hypothetical protein